jgi:hypothetical protein
MKGCIMNESERNAFVSAYVSNVAVAKKETVEKFLDRYLDNPDGDNLYHEFGCDYTSIMDALGVWQSAINYRDSFDIKE